MKSYLSQGNRVIIKFVTNDSPSKEQHNKYNNEGLPIGFKLLWTEVNGLVNEDEIDQPCDGFTCNGGEVCIDNGQNICAERTKLCISKELQCNGISNCLENDNSDEYNCKFIYIISIYYYYIILGYSDQIIWTAIGAFFIIISCTILAIVIHRITMKREIKKRLREEAKTMKRNQSNYDNNSNNMDLQINAFNQPRASDVSGLSVPSMASISIARARRFSPAFFAWSRRTSTADSVTPSLTLHETPIIPSQIRNIDNNNVWQFSKELSPQPPRVRLQQLEPGRLNHRKGGVPIATSEDSDDPKSSAKNRSNIDGTTLRYSHTAAV